MIFDLVNDFANVLDIMPREHPRYRILKLLGKALRRDIHFIDRHPTTLFQCLWNSCWWDDCPERAKYFTGTQSDTPGDAADRAPWMHQLLERWRRECKSGQSANGAEKRVNQPWLRALLPPATRLNDEAEVQLAGNYDVVTDAAFSPDGRLVATVGISVSSRRGSTPLTIWNAHDGSLFRIFPELQHGTGRVEIAGPIRWFPNGRELAVAISRRDQTAVRGIVFRISADEGRILDNFEVEHAITALDIDAAGSTIAVAGQSVTCLDVASGRRWSALTPLAKATASLQFTADGVRLVTGGLDGAVRVWNTSDLSSLNSFTLPDTDFVRAALIPGQELLMTCEQGDEGEGYRWSRVAVRELDTMEIVAEIFHSAGEWTIDAIAVSSNGERLAFNLDAHICVVELRRQEARKLRDHGQNVISLAFAAEGERLVSCRGSVAKIWEVMSPNRHDAGVFRWPTRHISFRPDGQKLATISEWTAEMRTGANDVWLWNMAGECDELRLFGPVDFVHWSRDGKTIYGAGANGRVEVWDLRRHDWYDHFGCSLPENAQVMNLAVSPDEALLAVLTDSGVFVFDARDGEPRSVLPIECPDGCALTMSEAQLAFSPRSQLLAATVNVARENTEPSDEGACFVQVWSLATGASISRTPMDSAEITAIDFSQDEQSFAAGREDGRLQIWCVETGTLLHEVVAHTASVEDVLLLAEGRHVLSSQKLHAPPRTCLWSVPALQSEACWEGCLDLPALGAVIRDGIVVERRLIGQALANEYRVMLLPEMDLVAAVPIEAMTQYAFHSGSQVVAGCDWSHLYMHQLEVENLELFQEPKPTNAR